MAGAPQGEVRRSTLMPVSGLRVVLVWLNKVEVGTLALREAVLAVKLKLAVTTGFSPQQCMLSAVSARTNEPASETPDIVLSLLFLKPALPPATDADGQACAETETSAAPASTNRPVEALM